MQEGFPKLLIANTLAAAAAAVFALMATCSQDRLEDQVIRLRKAVESRGVGSAGAAATAGSTGPTGSSGTAATAGRELRVGEPTGVEAVGWDGRRAPVLCVEGHVPNPPLTLEDKNRFRPQNDWYVMQWASAAKSYNYYTTNESECGQVVRYVLQGLMAVDPDAPPGVVPRLATSWEVAPDHLTYTYRLRRGVQFADGRPFTSADVKFSFDCIRDTDVGAAHLAPSFEDVKSLETPDEHTVVVHYKKPYWRGLYAVGVNLWVLNKGWYEEQIPLYAKRHGIEKFSTEPGKPGFGEVFRKIRTPCPGAGPYYLRSEDDMTQERIVLYQNPFYYGIQTNPTWWNFLQVRRVYIKDPAAVDEAFLKQEFDVMSVPHDRYADQLKDDPKIQQLANYMLYDHTGLDTVYFCWNCRRPPFDDARVRTAMTHLLDREWIRDRLYRGNGVIATCKSKRSYPTYSLDLVPHAFDVEKAKALLGEAGWKDSDGDGVLDKEIAGKRVPFQFTMKGPASGGPFGEQVTGQFRAACQKAGIRMDFVTSEWSTFIGQFEQREFDAAFLGSSWGDPWIDLYEGYHSSQDVPAGGNASGWHDKRVDDLLEAMREEFDETKRTEMFHEFNKLFYDAQPETLFCHPLVAVLLNKRIQGAKVRPTGLQPFDMWVEPKDVLHK